jgi:hypothetical protein
MTSATLGSSHNCDICGQHPDTIIDGPVKSGQWAWMCCACWSRVGKYNSLGIGKGQAFKNVKGGMQLKDINKGQ